MDTNGDKSNMKKRIISIFVIVLLGIFAFNNMYEVRADSGFGGSYGGESSSGGSYSGGSSSYSGSSNSGLSETEMLIVVLISIILIVVILIIYSRKEIKKIEQQKQKKYEEMKNKIDSIIGIDYSKLQEMAFELYKNIQIAWMNFDYDTLRKYVTDEMFNMYKEQLQTLKVKNQQNIMENIILRDFIIEEVKEENNNIVLTTNIKIKCNDYIIDTNTKKVVKGKKNQSILYSYKITFIKNNNSNINVCPNCGAKITNNASNKCEFCDSIIVSNNYNWVMSKKEVLLQMYIGK